MNESVIDVTYAFYLKTANGGGRRLKNVACNDAYIMFREAVK